MRSRHAGKDTPSLCFFDFKTAGIQGVVIFLCLALALPILIMQFMGVETRDLSLERVVEPAPGESGIAVKI